MGGRSAGGLGRLIFLPSFHFHLFASRSSDTPSSSFIFRPSPPFFILKKVKKQNKEKKNKPILPRS